MLEAYRGDRKSQARFIKPSTGRPQIRLAEEPIHPRVAFPKPLGLADLSSLGSDSRSGNSKPTLRSGVTTRNAEKGLPVLLETNSFNRSVLPAESSLTSCSRSIGRCKIVFPVLNLHGF